MNGSGRKEEPLYNGPSAYPKGSSMKMAILGLSAICSSTLFGCSRDGNDDGNNDGPNNGGPNNGGPNDGSGDEDPNDPPDQDPTACVDVEWKTLFAGTTRVDTLDACMECVRFPDDSDLLGPSAIAELAEAFDSDCGGGALPPCALYPDDDNSACQTCLTQNAEDPDFCRTGVSTPPPPPPTTDKPCQGSRFGTFFDGGNVLEICLACVTQDPPGFILPDDPNTLTDNGILELATQFDRCGGDAATSAPCAFDPTHSERNGDCQLCVSAQCGRWIDYQFCEISNGQGVEPWSSNYESGSVWCQKQIVV